MDTTDNVVSSVSAIDKAIAAAKARKAAKAGTSSSLTPAAEKPAKTKDKSAKVEVATKKPSGRARISDEERARRVKQLEDERVARKAAKLQAKLDKQAAAEANKRPAHMTKVEKAAASLPGLGDLELSAFNEITTNFTASQITALAAHLEHFNRVEATKRAADTKLEAGMTVKIVSGLPKYVGRTATVVKAQRIRCYVQVEGVDKDLYCFTSDVVPVEVTSDLADTGTEG